MSNKDILKIILKFEYLMDNTISFTIDKELKEDLKTLIKECRAVYYKNLDYETLIESIYNDIKNEMGWNPYDE